MTPNRIDIRGWGAWALVLVVVAWFTASEAVNWYAFGEWRCVFVRCVAVYEP